MVFNLVVTEEAHKDILQAYNYYNQQLAGLGDRFLDKLEERFAAISTHPEYYSFIDNKQILRDITIVDFPFVIVYEVTGSNVIVYAICSTYKKPYQKSK